jgi:ABC-type multidrug transport system fused ATPase/permease subunit
MDNLRKLGGLLTPAERKQASVLLCMIFLVALLETIGVASIMPFMAVLANPELVHTNGFLHSAFAIATRVGVVTVQQFLFALGAICFLLLLVSLTLKAITTYAQIRFTLMREFTIGKRLVEGYLHQPYSWFLNRHSADLGKTILSEVSTVIGNGLLPMMTLISQSVLVFSLFLLLIIVDLQLALVVGPILIGFYALIFKICGTFVARIGGDRLRANQERFNAVVEALGAIKEIKIRGLEQAYTRRFSEPAQTYAGRWALAQGIAQLPRFFLEVISFGGIMLVMLYLVAKSNDFTHAIPIISLYAFTGYRLMPALQQAYNAITLLRFVGPALDKLYADLKSLQEPIPVGPRHIPITLSKAITLNCINYRYSNDSQPALKNLSLTIPAQSAVGIVGSTGSGKTTTVDLILGLLQAEGCTLKIDDQIISDSNRRCWQRMVGYVPQQIYLSDDTVAANIAFGLSAKDIDYDGVERAAKIANLHDFVCDYLPQRYHTTVGERGVRLSGGQRQRIGIARALYNNPRVLILDEATNALDNTTEMLVMEALHKHMRGVTLIIIAHRLSSVKNCELIFQLEKGEVRAKGTFDEVMKSWGEFQRKSTIKSSRNTPSEILTEDIHNKISNKA